MEQSDPVCNAHYQRLAGLLRARRRQLCAEALRSRMPATDRPRRRRPPVTAANAFRIIDTAQPTVSVRGAVEPPFSRGALDVDRLIRGDVFRMHSRLAELASETAAITRLAGDVASAYQIPRHLTDTGILGAFGAVDPVVDAARKSAVASATAFTTQQFASRLSPVLGNSLTVVRPAFESLTRAAEHLSGRPPQASLVAAVGQRELSHLPRRVREATLALTSPHWVPPELGDDAVRLLARAVPSGPLARVDWAGMLGDHPALRMGRSLGALSVPGVFPTGALGVASALKRYRNFLPVGSEVLSRPELVAGLGAEFAHRMPPRHMRVGLDGFSPPWADIARQERLARRLVDATFMPADLLVGQVVADIELAAETTGPVADVDNEPAPGDTSLLAAAAELGHDLLREGTVRGAAGARWVWRTPLWFMPTLLDVWPTLDHHQRREVSAKAATAAGALMGVAHASFTGQAAELLIMVVVAIGAVADFYLLVDRLTARS